MSSARNEAAAALLGVLAVPALLSLPSLAGPPPPEYEVGRIEPNPLTNLGVAGSTVLAADPALGAVFGLRVDPPLLVQADGHGDTVLRHLPMGERPDFAVALASRQRLYVAHPEAGRVSVFHEATGALAAVHEFPGVCCFFRMGGLAAEPLLQRVYVALAGTPEVAVLDEAVGAVRTLPVRAAFVDVDPVAGRLYALSAPGEVSVVDAVTETVTGIVHFPQPAGASHMAVNPATGRLYFPFMLQNVNNLWIVDPDEPGNVRTLTLVFQPLMVLADPARNLVYVVAHDPPTMWVLDGATDEVIATVHLQIAGAPEACGERHYAAIDQLSGKVYVSCGGDVAVVQRRLPLE